MRQSFSGSRFMASKHILYKERPDQMKRQQRNLTRALLGLLTTIFLCAVLGTAQAAHAGGPPTSVVDIVSPGHVGM
jgi:hypothetical protein